MREQTPGQRARAIMRREKAQTEGSICEKRFMEAPEVASMLGVSLATVRSWSVNTDTRKPRIPYIKIGRNIIRYDRESLITWLKSQENVPQEMQK